MGRWGGRLPLRGYLASRWRRRRLGGCRGRSGWRRWPPRLVFDDVGIRYLGPLLRRLSPLEGWLGHGFGPGTRCGGRGRGCARAGASRRRRRWLLRQVSGRLGSRSRRTPGRGTRRGSARSMREARGLARSAGCPHRRSARGASSRWSAAPRSTRRQASPAGARWHDRQRLVGALRRGLVRTYRLVAGRLSIGRSHGSVFLRSYAVRRGAEELGLGQGSPRSPDAGGESLGPCPIPTIP
jgi:hypothetical protein